MQRNNDRRYGEISVSDEISLNDVHQLLTVSLHRVETTTHRDLRGQALEQIESDITALILMLQWRGLNLRVEKIEAEK